MTKPRIVFVATKTTGPNAFAHQIFEVGLLTPTEVELEADDGETEWEFAWEEHHWWLNVDLHQADPVILELGGFHERHPMGHANAHKLTSDRVKEVTDPEAFSTKFARLTHGMHLAGSVPSFDELFLRGLLLGNGQLPTWYNRPIDVETMAVGYLHGFAAARDHARDPLMPPWDLQEVSRSIGLPGQHEDHTALGGARWAKAIWERVTGVPSQPEETS